MAKLVFTRHALARMAEYGLSTLAITEIVQQPDWVEPDPRPGVERRFQKRGEIGGRILRVACRVENDHIVILSAHPDRNARSPK